MKDQDKSAAGGQNGSLLVQKEESNEDDDGSLSPSHLDEDRGWAWVVFGAVFVGRVIVLGTLLTCSIYFSQYLELFGSKRSVTAFIGSTMWFLYDLSGLVNALIVHRLGPRVSVIIGSLILTTSFLLSTLATSVVHLIITQGVLLGIGSNLISLAFVVGLKVYFRKHVNLSQGISTAGGGFGVFILSLLIPHLLDTYGWRGTFVLHGGLILNTCLVGAVLFPVRRGRLANGAIEATKCEESAWPRGWLSLWKMGCFWVLLFAYFCFNFSYVTSIVLFKDFAILRSLEDHFPAALTAFGIGDIAGRLGSGILTSWKRISPVLLFSVVHALCGSLLFLQMSVVTTGLSLILVALFFGFGSGCANGLFFIIPCHLYASDIFLAAFASCSAAGGLGSLISTPVAGYMVDQTQSYNGALGMASFFSFAASVLLLLLFFGNRRSDQKLIHQYSDVPVSYKI